MNSTRTLLVTAFCAIFLAAIHDGTAQTGGGVIIINPGGGTPPPPPVTSGVGPISTLFLTDVNSNHLLSITGTAISLDTIMVSDRERPLAVLDTIRTMSQSPGSGAEYSLAGTPNGTTYEYSPNVTGYFFDGTTDGNFNYAWNHLTGTAYRFDRQWQNPTELFSLGIADGRRLGITFDPSNNSLWLSGDYDGTASASIENRTLSGELISSFSTGHVNNWALALDPADGTLWQINGYGSGATSLLLEQYTRTGTKIGSATVITPSRYSAFGGEFAFTGTVVPEPSSALLLLIGGGAFCLLRRHSRK